MLVRKAVVIEKEYTHEEFTGYALDLIFDNISNISSMPIRALAEHLDYIDNIIDELQKIKRMAEDGKCNILI